MLGRSLLLLLMALSIGCAGRSTTLVVPELRSCDGLPHPTRPLRVASFNIRAGLSSSLESVGDAIASLEADVVALQEVDLGVHRTERVDQAGVVAERLGYEHAFAAAIKREGGSYGVALLSRYPLSRVLRIDLRSAASFEPRVAIDADVCYGARPVRVIAVHADIFPWSAMANARSLAAIARESVGKGVVILGDLNVTPDADAVRALMGVGLVDLISLHAEGPTFLEGNRRLDYILVDQAFRGMSAVRGADVRVSDHIPIWADLEPSHL
jgi:endonuclease/exonuclease/phosphatase family metal-dependent hydrolase